MPDFVLDGNLSQVSILSIEFYLKAKVDGEVKYKLIEVRAGVPYYEVI